MRVRYALGRLDQWMGRTSSAPRLLEGALRHGSVRGRWGTRAAFSGLIMRVGS